MTNYERIKNWFESGKDFESGKKIHFDLSKNYADKIKLAKPFLGMVIFLENKMNNLLDFYSKNDEPVKQKLVSVTVKTIHIADIPKDINERIRTEFERMPSFDELPQILQLLIIRRFSLKKKAVEFHAKMHEAPNDVDRLEAVKSCVTLMQENWKIWEEMDNYHVNGKVLGKHPIFSEYEFQTNIDKAKLKMEQVDFIKFCTQKKANLIQNINNAKKKGDTEKLKKHVSHFNIIAKELNEEELNYDIILNEITSKSETE